METERKVSLESAQVTAQTVLKKLQPYCKKIAVAGSIRRRRPWVHDIDIVLIPSDPWNLHQELLKLGQLSMSGTKIKKVIVASPGGPLAVDIYVATPETWATLLLIRTGSAQNNIRLATRAKDRGWHLAASGDGLFNENGQRVAGDTEESVYQALGLPYQPPEKRD